MQNYASQSFVGFEKRRLFFCGQRATTYHEREHLSRESVCGVRGISGSVDIHRGWIENDVPGGMFPKIIANQRGD